MFVCCEAKCSFLIHYQLVFVVRAATKYIGEAANTRCERLESCTQISHYDHVAGPEYISKTSEREIWFHQLEVP